MQQFKLTLWQFQAAVLILFTLSWATYSIVTGSNFLSGFDSTLTDLKFRVRGSRPASNKITLVEIDSRSIEALGRWPWKRNYVAVLIDKIFQLGASTLSLDIVFSERQANAIEEDAALQKIFSKYSDKITLSWITESLGASTCDKSSRALPSHALSNDQIRFTNAVCFSDPILNVGYFSNEIQSQGGANAIRDSDGIIRTANYFFRSGNQLFPSLPLAMVSNATHSPPERLVPSASTPIDYLGPEGSLPSLSALDILKLGERDLASGSLSLKEKHVLLGVSALAVGDRITTPFSPSVAGMEVQATIAEQILTGRFPKVRVFPVIALGICMSVLLIFFSMKLENFTLVFLFLFVYALTFFLDFKVLFPSGEHWPTALLYFEFSFVFLSTFIGRYYQERATRRFFKQAFSMYVSPAVVKTLLSNPKALKLGGTRKDVTVIFCDIVGFTRISEQLEPSKLAQLLNDYFTLLTTVIFKYQGTVDKFIGDSLMAFFGAPIDQIDHADRCLKSALEISRLIQVENVNFKRNFGIENLEIGIGINSGTVSVGNMGAKQRLSYTVIGDNVNIAARLQEMTRKYKVQILTTRATLNNLSPEQALNYTERVVDQVQLKGKTQSLDLIEIQDRDSQTTICNTPALGL